MVAQGEPRKSGGELEARLELFLLTNMYLHLAVFRVMEFSTSHLVANCIQITLKKIVMDR